MKADEINFNLIKQDKYQLYDFAPCEECVARHKADKRNTILGKIIFTDNHGNRKAKDCKCRADWKKESLLKLKMKEGNIPFIVYNLGFDSYVGKGKRVINDFLKKYIEDFGKGESNLYMYGKPGTQKTTSAWIIGFKLLCKGYSVKYTTMLDLTKIAMSTEFNEDYKEELILNEDIDLLIIDESFDPQKFQAFRNSNYQIAPLMNVIKKRIELLGQSTIFISNIAPEDIDLELFPEAFKDMILREMFHETGTLFFPDKYHKVKTDFKPEDLFKVKGDTI